jgi:hypothetical protein
MTIARVMKTRLHRRRRGRGEEAPRRRVDQRSRAMISVTRDPYTVRHPGDPDVVDDLRARSLLIGQPLLPDGEEDRA